MITVLYSVRCIIIKSVSISAASLYVSITTANQSALPLPAGPITAVHEVQLRGAGAVRSAGEAFLTNQRLTVDRKRQISGLDSQSATGEGGLCPPTSHVTLLSSSQAVTSESWRWVKRPINVTFYQRTQRDCCIFGEVCGCLWCLCTKNVDNDRF